jgi:DNA-binding CsgD family transcriptional regulator
MTNSKSSLDTSDELLIQKCKNGVQLVRPDKIDKGLFSISANLFHTVKSLLQLPLHVYFMDSESTVQNMNELTMALCGYTTNKGVSIRSSAAGESAERIINHDREILKTNKIKICDEDFIRKTDKIDLPIISIKFPWYNNEDKAIGVIGFSILTNQHDNYTLANAINFIYGKILSISSEVSEILPGLEVSGVYLTKRESECLKYLLLGMSAKSIARILCVSHRTIESHFEKVKLKMEVSSKAALAEKFFYYSKFIRK